MTTTTTPAAPAFRYIGITDEVVNCAKCDKPNLKSTVVLALLDADGNVEDVTHYGSTCAARALAVRGGGRKVLEQARAAHRETVGKAEWAREVFAVRRWVVDAPPAGLDLSVDAWKDRRRLHGHGSWSRFLEIDRKGWAEWRRRVVADHARLAADIRAAELIGA